MLFAAFTSAYIVRQAEGNWVHFELPEMFYVSTGILLLSSVFMQWAVVAVKKNNLHAVKLGLLITLGLGLAFVFFQFLAWSALVEQKIFITGNPSGSFLYVISGVHVLHVAGGLMALVTVTAKSILEKYSSNNFSGVSLCATYWHFLDVLWIYLFVFLSVIR
jgi:cytochrome c oxidase subunit 3